MVPPLSRRINNFSLADSGNLALATSGCLMALGPDGSLAALNREGVALRPCPRNRANHNFKQRSRVSPPLGRGLSRGERR